MAIIAYVNTALNFLSSLLKLKRKPAKSLSFIGGGIYEDIGFREWAQVNWFLKYEKPSILDLDGKNDFLQLLKDGQKVSNTADASKYLSIDGPYCPHCNTGLSESKSFVLLWLTNKKYKWICDNCGFSIRSKKDKYQSREAAHRVFESKLRKAFETGNPNEI